MVKFHCRECRREADQLLAARCSHIREIAGRADIHDIGVRFIDRGWRFVSIDNLYRHSATFVLEIRVVFWWPVVLVLRVNESLLLTQTPRPPGRRASVGTCS